MPPEQNRNKIEELKKSLYSRTAPDVRTRRKLRFSEQTSEVKTDWEHPSEDVAQPVLNERYEDHSMSFFTKLLIGSILFCIIAVGLGAYLFFNGSNLISANNIDISVSGPVSVAGGTVVPFDIKVTNKNNVDLQVADLTVTFPSGSTDPSNPGTELTTYRELLGDIPSGGTLGKTVSAIMFGEENLQKQIIVTVTYKVKGSTSLFTKNTTYDVLINSSPIGVTTSSFREITSGQEFDIKVNLKSNSGQTLKNVLLKADYPFGFTFISSNPKSPLGTTLWKVGDIPAGAERVVTIHGKLSGEDSDVRVFHFTVGAQSSTNAQAIGTQYMAIDQDITIQKPFVSLTMAVDGDESDIDYVGKFGYGHRIKVTWFNNLSVPVSNAEIAVKLSGSAYNRGGVQTDQGFFRSGSDDIVWNQQSVPELASIRAGDSGSVYFTLTPQDNGSATNPTVNPIVTLKADISGNRVQENNVPVRLDSAVTKNIRVSSNLALTGRVVRSVGPFTNTGPIPPKPDQPTSYTVIWTVDNTANIATNGKVTATIPPYVTWLGVTSPTSEQVSYDKNKGEITWDIGSIGTYTANTSRRKEVAFQLSITPSVNQIDQSPTLVNQATLTGVDSFTRAQLQSQQDLVSTRFSTDPTYREGQETVVR